MLSLFKTCKTNSPRLPCSAYLHVFFFRLSIDIRAAQPEPSSSYYFMFVSLSVLFPLSVHQRPEAGPACFSSITFWRHRSAFLPAHSSDERPLEAGRVSDASSSFRTQNPARNFCLTDVRRWQLAGEVSFLWECFICTDNRGIFSGQIRNSDQKEVNVGPVLEVTPRVLCFAPSAPALGEDGTQKMCRSGGWDTAR